jgi:hypothetical protein
MYVQIQPKHCLILSYTKNNTYFEYLISYVQVCVIFLIE